MGKYIWPGQLGKAALWYMELLYAASRGVTLNEFIELIGEDHPRKTVLARLERLRNKKLVARSGQGHKFTYTLTAKGMHELGLMKLHRIDPPDQWDSTWRIVIFDIPETKREARHHIRRLLRELGFIQLQMSVWVHPFAVLGQFKQLQAAYGIAEHLFLLEVPNFEPPADIVSHFVDSYPRVTFK
jgi:DNA-binding transcriptional regulator PaaX